MKYRKIKITYLIFTCCIGFNLQNCKNTDKPIPSIVLENATIIIGDGSLPIENTVVVIKDGKIIKTGIVGQVEYSKNAKVLNLKGKWILPGFMNLHFHINTVEQEEVLKTLLQFGITTIRNAAATPEFGVQLRDKIRTSEIVGPRMLTAGELIDIKGGFWSDAPNAVGVETIEEMKKEVQRQAKLSVDYIKLYADLPPDLVGAGIVEAKSLGLKTMGHLGKTGWGQAAEMGINTVTHSGTAAPTWELVPQKDQSRFRNFYAPHQKPQFDHTLFAPWRNLVNLDGPEFTQMVSSIVKNNVEVNPTLVICEVMFWGDDPNVRELYEPDYAPVSLRKKWREGRHPYTASWPNESMDEAKKVFKVNQEIVKRLYNAGALITTGTDFPLPWITPGVALHREMQILYEAGIPALDVITIATSNGAKALGILDDVGTVEAGKQADLVILGADPVEDIRNTRKIEKVFLAGKVVYSIDESN